GVFMGFITRWWTRGGGPRGCLNARPAGPAAAAASLHAVQLAFWAAVALTVVSLVAAGMMTGGPEAGTVR
ncbi:hypothetical protein, partial [Streptomyces rimosus]